MERATSSSKVHSRKQTITQSAARYGEDGAEKQNGVKLGFAEFDNSLHMKHACLQRGLGKGRNLLGL